MHQRKYSLEISEAGQSTSKPTVTPIDTNTKLTIKQNDFINTTTDTKKTSHDLLNDQQTYQRLIGKLLYLTMTRPDISYRVQVLNQFLQQPKKSLIEAATRIVRYIKK